MLSKRINVKLALRLSNYCNVSSQRNNQIKLTNYDDKKERAHDSQIVRAKETSTRVMVGPANDKHQAPTNGLKLYVRAIIKSEA